MKNEIREEVSMQVQSAVSPLAKKIQENTDITIETRENTREFMAASGERDLRMQSVVIGQSEMNEILKEVVDQTKQTNGRVKALELWRQFILGGLAILSILVVPILLAIILKRL